MIQVIDELPQLSVYLFYLIFEWGEIVVIPDKYMFCQRFCLVQRIYPIILLVTHLVKYVKNI